MSYSLYCSQLFFLFVFFLKLCLDIPNTFLQMPINSQLMVNYRLLSCS